MQASLRLGPPPPPWLDDHRELDSEGEEEEEDAETISSSSSGSVAESGEAVETPEPARNGPSAHPPPEQTANGHSRHLVSDLHEMIVGSVRQRDPHLHGDKLDAALQTTEESSWAIDQDNKRRTRDWGFASTGEIGAALARQQCSLNQLYELTRASEASALARVDLARQQLQQQEEQYERSCRALGLERQAKLDQLLEIAQQLQDREQRVTDLEVSLRAKKREVHALHVRACGADLNGHLPTRVANESPAAHSVGQSTIGGEVSAFRAVTGEGSRAPSTDLLGPHSVGPTPSPTLPPPLPSELPLPQPPPPPAGLPPNLGSAPGETETQSNPAAEASSQPSTASELW